MSKLTNCGPEWIPVFRRRHTQEREKEANGIYTKRKPTKQRKKKAKIEEEKVGEKKPRKRRKKAKKEEGKVLLYSL
jgi:hypothetical protein